MDLSLYRSTIEDRIEKLKSKYNDDYHETLLRLVFYLETGHGYDDLEDDDIIDGHGEYQIDILHIDTSKSESQVVVTIIQATYSESYGSTKLIKLHAGLDYLLNQPKSTYLGLSNSALRDKIQEFRDVRADVLPANIKLQCFYAALGDPDKAEGEFPEQIKRIKADYSKSVGEFSFEVLGPAEIYRLMNSKERKSAKVNEKVKIIFDQNKANLLEHSIGNVSGVICTTEAAEIARIVQKHPVVFDDNLRGFLGTSGAVNEDIRKSCTTPESASLFWFLNNGITIVCDDFDSNKDYDTPFIDIKNLRIVNGCQTATTLATAFEKNELQPATKVMIRIFKTQSPDLASKLVISTNNQNKITSRDLHAQDDIQKHIQTEFLDRFSLHYERMANEFVNSDDNLEVISNEKIGQAFLSIVKKRISDGSRRQYKVWGEHYNITFNSSIYPEAYLLAYRLVEFCNKVKRQKLAFHKDTDIERVLVKNGTYHLARIIAFKWRHDDDWNDLQKIRSELQKLKDEPNIFDSYYDTALNLLTNIFNSDDTFMQEPSVALKSSGLEDVIEKELYIELANSMSKRKRK